MFKIYMINLQTHTTFLAGFATMISLQKTDQSKENST